jgi:urea transport system ATP-binding protein
VLLLDEPTEGIQPSIIKDIAKALNEIRKLREITIVVSEQVLSASPWTWPTACS